MDTATPTPPARSQAVGVALVASGAVSVQFGAAVAVTLFRDIGAAGAVTARLVIAMLLLVVATLVGRWLHRGRPARRHTRGDWLTAAAFGVALAAMNLTFYESIARIPLGVAVAIELLGPLGLAAASSRRRLDVVWVLLAVAGVATLGLGESRGGAPVTAAGVGFGLAAGVFWAVYIVLSARTGARFERTDGLTAAMVVAAVLVTPVGLAGAGTALFTGHALWRGAVIALLSSGLPYSLDLLALRRIPPGMFGLLMSLEPAIASLAALVVVGQVLSAWQWAGLVAVVVACAGVTVFAPARRRADPVDAPAAVDAV